GLMVLLFVLAPALVAWRVQTIKRSNDQTFAALAIALIAFDLFTVNNPAYNAAPAPRYPETPLIQTMQNDHGVFRVADEGKLPGHFGIAYNLDEIGGISPLRIADYNALLDNLPPEKLWQLLNVRYVITGRPGFANADVVMTDGDTRLLRLNNAMPRAWFVPYAIQNGNDTQVLAAMSSDAFDPWYVAYVADSTAAPLPAPPAQGSDSRDTHAAEFQSITPEHSRVTVNAPADGLLVLSENYYYPGWRATVDGAPAPIVRADVGLAAVPVRAGARQVEFVFDPWSVKVGMAVTATTLVAMAIGMMIVLWIGREQDLGKTIAETLDFSYNMRGRKL
ncbi:MAG: YfhO family protein, partial [Chloroflexi bacterium]|nr:YfhO family protein [Chloroflexota bacterium]